MASRSRVLFVSIPLIVLSLILGACGTAQPAATSSAANPPAAQSGGEVVYATRPAPTIIRFVFAPDPLMKYMQDTGIVTKYEEQCNIRVKNISTWDETAFFGGGHADVASTGDYEVAALTEETGQNYVIFGNYNVSRVPIFVRTDSPYQSIKDLKGKKIGVPGPLSSTMIWGVMLKQTEGVDFKVGSPEFDLVVNEHVVNAELLRRGEIEAGIIVPEALIPELRDGTIRPLYGAGGAWEYYRDNFDPKKEHKGVPSNTFLARKDWYEANKEAARCFNAMWDAGLKEWHANQEDLIRLYPADWGLDSNAETFDQDVQTMAKWLQEHDWFTETVFMNQEWIDKELKLFDYMRQSGFMKADTPNPTFVVVEPMKSE